jgi:ankyrin repeat protein
MDAEHNTALYIAAKIRNIAAADGLLDHKANHEVPHSHEETPLMLLCGMSSYI